FRTQMFAVLVGQELQRWFHFLRELLAIERRNGDHESAETRAGVEQSRTHRSGIDMVTSFIGSLNKVVHQIPVKLFVRRFVHSVLHCGAANNSANAGRCDRRSSTGWVPESG